MWVAFHLDHRDHKDHQGQLGHKVLKDHKDLRDHKDLGTTWTTRSTGANGPQGPQGPQGPPGVGVVITDPENTAVGDQALVNNTGGSNTATGFGSLLQQHHRLSAIRPMALKRSLTTPAAATTRPPVIARS